ncbi:MAG: hypothetical protein Q9181_005489 [Wetmoreana brouardii]
MPAPYSVHSINESEVPIWLPGEDLAVAGFLAMTILLALEINVQIHHFFHRRKGVYFWAMQLGPRGCIMDALGLLTRYLIPNAIRIWHLYTLMTSTGWAVYTVGQLVVLYSRLHLAVENENVQLAVLWAIVIVSPVLVITDWCNTWLSWNPAISHRWSPAQAIVERTCQLGFSILKVAINVIYAVWVTKMLRRRVNVRQRRVMLDLIYVNALAVAFDIMNIVLVYVNHVDISHSIQVFSYAMKLRLEFIVLNRLMAVTAPGTPHQIRGEKRYHHPLRPQTNWAVGEGFWRKERSDCCLHSLQLYPSNGTRKSTLPTSVPDPIFLEVASHPEIPTFSMPYTALRGVNS